MKQYRRVGECNRCGECCIAPWGPDKITAYNAWANKEDVQNSWPITKLIPLPIWSGKYKGSIDLEGQTIEYEWAEGVGICKSADDRACPFLGDERDGQRLCRLMGTAHEDIWHDLCEFAPREIVNENNLKRWQMYNPNCSYEFEEID